jgi:HSP20 family molecular chaperone IbpA
MSGKSISHYWHMADSTDVMIVPEGITEDQVKATYKDGLLELTLPKPQEQKPQPKRIKIT